MNMKKICSCFWDNSPLSQNSTTWDEPYWFSFFQHYSYSNIYQLMLPSKKFNIHQFSIGILFVPKFQTTLGIILVKLEISRWLEIEISIIMFFTTPTHLVLSYRTIPLVGKTWLLHQCSLSNNSSLILKKMSSYWLTRVVNLLIIISDLNFLYLLFYY